MYLLGYRSSLLCKHVATSLLLTVLSLACFSRTGAQERVIVQPSGSMTWDEMVLVDVQRVNIPTPQRAIHSPMPGPKPREIGFASLPVNKRVISTEPEPLIPNSPGKLPLTPMVIPTLSFNTLLDNNTIIPPDTYGSVGPSHVMTMLNSEVRIHTKAGATVSTVSLSTFWTAISGSKFDPKVNYDAGSGRWLAVCDANANSDTSKVCFAISDTSDPTGTWTFYEFDADAADTTWADYPGFGHNATWIAITHNMFTVAASPLFVGEKMWVIDKSTAVAGGPLTTTVFATGFDLSGGVDGFTMQPCVTFGAAETLYIVDNSGWSSGGTFLVRISRITGTGPAPTWSVQPGSVFASTGLFFVANNFFFTQIDAPQLGTATLVETNDPRMLNSVFRNGRIWCTHSAGLPVGGPSTRTAAFWYQLDPTAMPTPIVQSGVLDDGEGVHYYFPSITANSLNDACIGFSRSDGTKFVEAAYSGRLASDPLGMMPFGTLVFKLGESSYSKFFSGSRNRWGDYSNTCVDPSDDLTFWSIQEYAGTNVGPGVNDGRWATRWAKIVPPGDLPIQLAYFTGGPTQQGYVHLQWGTISETNNYGFEVEKSPDEPTSYQLIPNSFVPGHGTTLEPQHYSYTDTTATAGLWWYRLKQIDLDGTVHYLDGIAADILTGVSEKSLPVAYSLGQNYPNPFNPTTLIQYSLPTSGHVSLTIHDVLGREVATLVDSRHQSGYYESEWDATGVSSGVYFYRIQSGDYVDMKKLVLMK